MNDTTRDRRAGRSSQTVAEDGGPGGAGDGTPRVATGVPGLDAVLEGGLPSGHLYLIAGAPGTGKTTLALQILLEGLRRGERCMYIPLSETAEEIAQIARSHGWDIKGLDVFELAAADSALTAKEQYTVFHPSEIELGETMQRIIERVEATGPSRVVIDSLSELRLLAHDPLRYRRQILGLKQFFTRRGCTAMLLDDRTLPDVGEQPQSIAHGIIEVERLPVQYGSERRRLQVSKVRGCSYRGGYHDLVIRRGGLVVFPRTGSTGIDSPSEVGPSVSTGLPEFDDLFAGGIDRGTSTLLLGSAGTGKSSLAIKIADAAARRGEKSAVFAFEENQSIACRRCAALGIPLAEHIRRGLISFRHIDPAELSPGEFAFLAGEAVDRHGAACVVVDSLNGYLNSMPEEKFLTAQLHELLGYLNARGVVTLMVLAQPGMLGSFGAARSPVDLSYLADSIVLLRNFEAFGSVRKAISVVKKRTGRHEDTIRELRFGDGGLRVGGVLENFRGVLTGVPEYVGSVETLSRSPGEAG